MNNSLSVLRLDEIERRIDDAESRGERAFRDLAALVSEVFHRELWREIGLPNFASWCERRGRSKSWGLHLKDAHPLATIVSCEGQARELKGLTTDQAKEAVSTARIAGKVTAEALARRREEILARGPQGAVEVARRANADAERGAYRIEAARRQKKLLGMLRRAKREARGLADVAEEVEGLIDKAITLVESSLEAA